MKKLKAKLLTYLFKDWVKSEKDVEALLLTRDMITERKNELVGHTPILGFRMHTTNEIK
tara:strand:+ start:1362 stop:1538 length:177 start_codon:yes stop_codon:yes gene_type:complete